MALRPVKGIPAEIIEGIFITDIVSYNNKISPCYTSNELGKG